jgi:DNA-binding SARP family transcriptional activator
MNGNGWLQGPVDVSLEEAIFDQLPYGLIVLSRTGQLLLANQAARHLLPTTAPDPGAAGPRCCDLLGCRRGPGPLEDACLTELVSESGWALSAMRLERPESRGNGRSLLTVVPVALSESHIVVQISAPQVEELQLQPMSALEPNVSLRVFTLGPTRLETEEGTIDAPWLEQRPGEVLEYLICERQRAVPTDEIAEAIWPAAGPSSVTNVRFAIHELRRRLEPDRRHRARSSFVVSGKGRYRLDTRNVYVDADDFHAAVEHGIGAFVDGRDSVAATSLDHALDLYKGEFLMDAPYADWAALERSRLHELAVKALRLRAELARRAGRIEQEFEYLRRVGRMEPLDMAIQRDWLAACLRLGRHGEASRHYAALRQRMLREFGRPPVFELGELLDEQPAQLALI